MTSHLYSVLLRSGLTDTGTEDRQGKPRSSLPMITAVAVTTKAMMIVSLRQNNDRWDYCELQSRCFVLRDVDQASLIKLSRDVSAFTYRLGVPKIFLREPAIAGPYAAHGDTHRLTTVIQLMPGIVIQSVHFASIAAWSRRSASILPEPAHLTVENGLSKRLAFDLCDRAIEAAAYAGSHLLSEAR